MRPPAYRYPTDSCADHTIIDGEFCIDCGRSILDLADEEQNAGLQWKVIGAWLGLLGGGLAFGFGQMIMIAREGRSGPLLTPLRALAKPDPNDPEGVPVGVRIAYWCVRGGSLLFIACAFALVFLPVVKRRRYLG